MAFIAIGPMNVFNRHEHCIKMTGLAFRMYATDHEGQFPVSSNGFGDALLLLVKHGSLGVVDARCLTAPGDDAEVFKEALKTGVPIADEQCSRVYIQGLSESNNPGIAILFDKKPTRGGDHGRSPWGSFLREVCLADGSMKMVREGNWASFASNQIELLVEAGFERSVAERYYRIQ